jgi:hypothetical protein
MKYRALRFLPLAFLAGTHGFALFAPYVAVVLTALHLVQRHRRARPAAGVAPADALPELV